ncbi:fluoride efflux transporter FluC [Lysobacter gummosus]|uniref:Fluoride-specific ion channel FluC n=1 Tax=Lysobacter gummosus TaxID=262324 RepID=A0ABY3XJC6_9GAMM|nr:CrcB family protein [Lysobacter gummosus]ALN91344.1 crcB-like family protein [Lysobacter gummosus]UNP31729.1 CrcB family protein [Lysobacter gummosus]
MTRAALLQLLAVGLGGAFGAMLRHGANLLLPRSAAPWPALSTLCVNVVGCLCAGLLLVWLGGREDADFWRALLLTGVLGGLTTFSAFGVDLLALLRAARYDWLALTIAAHVGLGLLAIVAGWRLGQMAWPGRI